MADFPDHFSSYAAAYSEHRPRYPSALFAHLASLTAGHDLAWDCGCGNGQASVELASHYTAVTATDASEAQLREATPHPRVTYAVARAERSPLADGSADLVAVAQAVHWFDPEPFAAEVRRVLRPGGLIAVWAYPLHEITPAVDAVLGRLYVDIVGPYWPQRRRVIDEHLRTLPFPFDEIDVPAFEMTHRWSLPRLLDYIGTWSAVQRYRKDRGEDPVALVAADLEQAWGDPRAEREIRWPLIVRAGRV